MAGYWMLNLKKFQLFDKEIADYHVVDLLFIDIVPNWEEWISFLLLYS